jgi:hypothetical protein
MTYDDDEAGKAVDDLTLATTQLNEVLVAVGRQPLPLPLRATPIGPFFVALIKLIENLAVDAAAQA